MGYVETGLIDAQALREDYGRRRQEEDRHRASARMEEVWDLYHRTLHDNEVEFCDQLVSALREDMGYLPLHVIDASLSKLSELGRAGNAIALFEQLKTQHPKLLEVDPTDLFGQLTYAPLKAHVQQFADTLSVDDRPLSAVIEATVSENFLELRDRERLAKFSAQDYVDYFIKSEQKRLTGRLRHLAQLSRVGQDEFEKKIQSDILAAARIIAKTSRLNHARMKSMGLVGDDLESPLPFRDELPADPALQPEIESSDDETR
jgi:hypothetical protein